MDLNEKQRKYLRGLAHELKPTVFIGMSGVSENVLREFDQCLEHHELIKIKFRLGSREARDEAIQKLVRSGQAQLIKRIGNTAIIFRQKHTDSRIKLP